MSQTCPEPCDQPAVPAEVATTGRTSALVWRGFHLRWSYNHRVNRLGSFVWPDGEGAARAVVTAASGTGKDAALVETCASWVEAPGVTAHTGATTFPLVGREGRPIDATVSVRVPGIDAARAAVVLGGLDLRVASAGGGKPDSDKLQRLVVGVRGLRADGDGVRFELDARLVARCRSAECKPFDGDVTYKLQVWFTVLAGPGVVGSAVVPLHVAYAWDTETPVTPERRFADVALPAAGEVFVGLERFECLLDREHHLLELAALTDTAQPVGGGRWRFGWKLGFVNWRPGMGKIQKFSFPAAGSVALGARARAVGFAAGRCVRQDQDGCVSWPGENTPADTTAAVCAHALRKDGVA